MFAQGLKWNDSFAVYLYTWNHYVSVGLSVVVLTLPHGLPLTFLVSLNKVIKAFAQEHILVKRLGAVEQLAQVNQLVTENSQTLTPGKLSVVKLWNGIHHTIEGEHISLLLNEEQDELLLQNLACNTLGTMEDAKEVDKACLRMVTQMGHNSEVLRSEYLTDYFVRFPSTGERKRLSTILTNI